MVLQLTMSLIVALVCMKMGETPIVASATLPKQWLAAPISGSATAVKQSEFDRVYPVIRAELKLYPASVIRELAKVQVLRSIKFYGQEYGGTNSLDTVYLTVNGLEAGYTAQYVAASTHHEFSSILLRNHPRYLDQIAWKFTLPTGFSYSGNGMEALKSKTAGTALDPLLAEKGFLTQYSQSSQEEDFNMIVGNLFKGGKQFWHVVDHYPKAAAKVRLVIRFYTRLDKQFTEEWFRKLS